MNPLPQAIVLCASVKTGALFCYNSVDLNEELIGATWRDQKANGKAPEEDRFTEEFC
jgi:hypothetical protein